MPNFSGIFVNIGEPDNDDFAKAVLEHHIGDGVKFAITSSTVPDLRRDLMNFVTTSLAVGRVDRNKNNSLDIIAHAPGGIQKIVDSLLVAIVDDGRERGDDDALVALLRANFSQCRLLGCVTAVDRDVCVTVRSLANRLGLRVIGTLRPIHEADFGVISFQDIQLIEGQKQSILHTIAPDPTEVPRVADVDDRAPPPSGGGGIARKDPSEKPEAIGDPDEERMALAGRILKAWLETFRQVTIEVGDVGGESGGASSVWKSPDELVGSTVAVIDAFRAPVEDVVMLQSPSGTSFFAEVLARGTLLRLRSKRYGQVYVGIHPSSPQRSDWLFRKAGEQAT